jgi:hypothetical protein
MKTWALVLAAGSPSAAAADHGRSILIPVHESTRLRADSAVIEGRLCADQAVECDYPVRVSIERRGEFLAVTSTSSHRRMRVRVPLSRVPDLDLESLRLYGHYRPQELVTIEVRFGEPIDCYQNDDGRPRLMVFLDAERGNRARIESYEGCEIRSELVAGEMEAEIDRKPD